MYPKVSDGESNPLINTPIWQKEKLIKKGYQEAEEIKSKAKKNIPKATKFISTEFERAANA